MIALGYGLSAIGCGLAMFFLVAWIAFDSSQWQALFASPRGWIPILVAGAAALGFWIWMLVSHLRTRPRESGGWSLTLILGAHLGAVAYFFTVYRRRLRP